MAIKTTPADVAFSRCIRERANWTCERCGKHYPDAAAAGKSQSVHCSHMVGRGNWSVRLDPWNAFCHCYGCHSVFGADGAYQKEHYIEIHGSGAYELLMERKASTALGREAKKSVKEIAKHYRGEFARMRELRMEGEMGRIEFTGYF